MPIEFRIKHASLLAALAAAYPCVSYSAGAASIDFAVGDVKALLPDGRSRVLVKGAEVNSGEMIDTGSGRAQVRFSDGAQVSLQPQTQFRIDNYQFKDKVDGSEKGFFSLLKGGMRTITGLIGRSNRDNYKVSTTVATIGIRGTEYSVAYGNSITVSTGEGSIELCNAGGCMILNSGESGYVKDGNTTPVRTDGKTSLPPAQPTGTLEEFAAKGEERSPSGGLPPLSSPMLSGSGYAVAYSSYSAGQAAITPPITIFDANSQLVSASEAVPYDAVFSTAIAGGFADGIIGWGRWSSGTVYTCGSTYSNVKDIHYVVGIPTATLPASGTATYSLLGFSYPTSSTGVVGTQAVTGSITANFGAMTASIGLGVPIGGYNFDFSKTASTINSSVPHISDTLTCNSGPCSGGANIQGFFAGANAERAGFVYKFDTTPSGLGTVNGAVAFRK